MKRLLNAVGENRWFSVTAVCSERRNLVLRFESSAAPADGAIGAWLVSCRQVREFSLTDFDGGGLNFWTKSHPLLSQFSSRKASLRVTVGRRTMAECVGMLLKVHRQSVDGWIDFDRFLPPGLSTRTDARPLVISGPEFLLINYQRGLEAAGFGATLKRYERALYWSGFGWSERRHPVSLLHFGNSFVVAESFSAQAEATRHMLPNKRLQRSALGAIVKRRG
jgi:hypothetical protein